MSNNKNFHSSMGEAFFSDALTVVFGKGRFVLDFKKTAPRIDQVGDDQNQTLVTEHEPLIIQPEAAKMMLRILENNVEKYEEKFGEIELPERDGSDEIEEETSADTRNYIG